MPYDRFMIAPLNTGLETDVKPWILPDDAYSRLINMYIFRGRLRKRIGSRLLNGSVDVTLAQLYSRVRINVATVGGGGTASGTAPGIIWEIGQAFVTQDTLGNDVMLTVHQANGSMYTTGTVTGTFNTATGAYTIAAAKVGAAVYFYPAQPIMGIIEYDTDAINNEPTYIFDTQFAYFWDGTGFQRLGTAVWTGTNYDFFWGATWQGVTPDLRALFVSNFNFAATLTGSDPIRTWDGTTWTDFTPNFNSSAATNTILTARIIVPFKNRLLLLNVVENTGVAPGTNTQYTNRMRFSQNGSPFTSDAWDEVTPGKGGFLDAPTVEAITTAFFLKDRLIVYFESSVWEIVYTGNEILPFRWQQINSELGAESTFSVVPFDKVTIAIGNVGVHACTGSNVERIDEKIPEEIFNIDNTNQGILRVYGIRDYFTELVYWTMPFDTTTTFPNRILVYNYRTASWSFFTDSITAFGYFLQQNTQTWGNTTKTWEQSIETWENASQSANFKDIIAGNQEGFIFIMDADETRNAPALQITDITISGSGVITITARNHNLEVGELEDYVAIENVRGSGNLTNLNGHIYQVDSVTGIHTFTIIDPTVTTGAYQGGGTIARVSNIDVWTKQYNFYVENGRNAYVAKVDFLVDRTVNGQFSVEYLPSASAVSIAETVLETNPYPLIPFEAQQDRLWHPVYPYTEGETVQLHLFLADPQIRNPDIAWSDIQIHALTFYATATSSRLQ